MAGTTISSGNLISSRDLDAKIPQNGGSTPVTSPRKFLEEITNEQTNDYTVQLTDEYKTILMNKGTAVNLTVPSNSSVAFAVNTKIKVRRIGAGALTFVQGSGVTITPSLGALTDGGATGEMTLLKVNTDSWYLDNGFPNTAVPTSRTLAGLDLSVNRLASALNIALGIAPPYQSGRLYGTASNYTTTTVAPLTANTFRAQPVLIKRSVTINALVAEVTTVGSFNFRLGIYADNGSGYPGSLIAQTAELDGSTPAAPSLRTGAVSATLTPGLYWLVIVTAGSITFRADANGAWPIELLGMDNSSQATIRQPYLLVAFTYASLPSTFTAGGTINTNAGSGTNAPIVWFKVA